MREVRHFAVAYFTTLLLAGCADLAERRDGGSFVRGHRGVHGNLVCNSKYPNLSRKGALNPTERYSLNDDNSSNRILLPYRF